MSVELGHFALVLALFVAAIQAGLPLWGAARGNRFLMGFAGPAASAQLLCCGLAFAALTYAYIVSDFSVVNVYENSHQDKPMLYKITGVWGNHEGSLLLWVLVMALFGAMVGWFGGRLPPGLKARTIGVQGLIGLGFLAFILFTSNPFTRVLPAPLEGRGLNPLLQDPGLAFHPPMLYLGYVGTSITFSFAIAALLERRVDPAWARWVRPWALLAWVFLTLGIALGSWWAYYELGWGGFWFWDPVENASLIPWLAATALLHSAIVVEKRDSLKRWTILLAIMAFGFSLMGTFLVRSGVITSVHAFATDPTRGLFILALMVAVVGGALILYARRAADLEPGGVFAPISREGALVLNNVLLSTALATVLLGTLYPMFLDAMDLGAVSVGPPYFNATFLPLMTPLALAMAAGPLISWKRADLRGIVQRLAAAAVLSLIGGALAYALAGGGPVLAPAGFALGLWLIFGSLTDIAERAGIASRSFATIRTRLPGIPRSAWGAALAHAGVGVVVLGLAGALWKTEVIQALRPGESMQVAGWTVTLRSVGQQRGPNYLAERAQISAVKGDRALLLTPEKRRYLAPPMTTTEAAIRTNLLGDFYAVLGDSDGQGRWAVRIYVNPLAPFLWLGSLLMGLGGLLSLTDRRLRLGVATRRAHAASPPASPAPAE